MNKRGEVNLEADGRCLQLCWSVADDVLYIFERTEKFGRSATQQIAIPRAALMALLADDKVLQIENMEQ